MASLSHKKETMTSPSVHLNAAIMSSLICWPITGIQKIGNLSFLKGKNWPEPPSRPHRHRWPYPLPKGYLEVSRLLLQQKTNLPVPYPFLCQQGSLYCQSNEHAWKLVTRAPSPPEKAPLPHLCSPHSAVWIPTVVLQGCTNLFPSTKPPENAEVGSPLNYWCLLQPPQHMA